MLPHKMNRGLRKIKAELMFEEYQVEIDPTRDKRKLWELKRRIEEIEKEQDRFYSDPITQSISL